MADCIDHLEFTENKCPDCGLDVDIYGNTADQFDYCCFPDCGCDGARVCSAKEGASDYANRNNVERMWSGKTHKQRKAALSLYGDVLKNKV